MILHVLLIAHFLADFTFQSTKWAQNKMIDFKYLISHSVVYALVFLGGLFPFIKLSNFILPYIIIIVSHFLIDWIRKFVHKKFDRQDINFIAFMIDQILHVMIIVILFYNFDLDANTTSLYRMIQQWPYFNRLIVYLLNFVIIWDPVAVFIKKLFTYVFDDHNGEQEKEPQAGRIIGKLERFIVVILLLCDQFGAIGFVLTAKSISRYKQLENKDFAEKYLVGTLTSVSFAFITTIILKQFL